LQAIGCQKVVFGSGIKDGPLFDGVGISADCLKKNQGGQGIILGRDWKRKSKVNISIHFICIVV
jgi:hypothetical protein